MRAHHEEAEPQHDGVVARTSDIGREPGSSTGCLMQRPRSSRSVIATAVGSRKTTIGAPSQTVPRPEPAQEGGTCSGRPQYKAKAPRAYPAKMTRFCVDRSERISCLLVASPSGLGEATGGPPAGARPVDQMLYQVLEHRRVQLVSNLLAVAFGHDETGFPKHGKVPGNRRPAGIESIGDLSRREGPIPQQPKNHPPSLVREGANAWIAAHRFRQALLDSRRLLSCGFGGLDVRRRRLRGRGSPSRRCGEHQREENPRDAAGCHSTNRPSGPAETAAECCACS